MRERTFNEIGRQMGSAIGNSTTNLDIGDHLLTMKSINQMDEPSEHLSESEMDPSRTGAQITIDDRFNSKISSDQSGGRFEMIEGDKDSVNQYDMRDTFLKDGYYKERIGSEQNDSLLSNDIAIANMDYGKTSQIQKSSLKHQKKMTLSNKKSMKNNGGTYTTSINDQEEEDPWTNDMNDEW